MANGFAEFFSETLVRTFCVLITQKTSMQCPHSESKFMDLVHQILQIMHDFKRKLYVPHSLGQNIVNIPITQKKFIDRRETKKRL
jgi:hypothetical protein